MFNKYHFLLPILILQISIMNTQYRFPFGQELKNVVQTDTTPKDIFVLGVYASAVHAQWVDVNGKTLVKALAVASEPYIFWKGDSAKEIIAEIKIPKELGYLIPAETKFNGPSGRCLDSFFLEPLKYKRENAWLCDLIPYSCQNESQQNALRREYDKYVQSGNLPSYSIPEVPYEFASEKRMQEIIEELKQSRADTVLLLGDQPIKYFLSRFTDKYEKLSDFEEYGMSIEIEIGNQIYTVIALAHPRQIGKLGKSNLKWYMKHKDWMESINSIVSGE